MTRGGSWFQKGTKVDVGFNYLPPDPDLLQRALADVKNTNTKRTRQRAFENMYDKNDKISEIDMKQFEKKEHLKGESLLCH